MFTVHNLKKTLISAGFDPVGQSPPEIVDDSIIDDVSEDSRQCGPKTVFVAIDGNEADGHKFLADAARGGSPVALVTRMPDSAPDSMALIQVPDTRRAIGPLAHELHGNPSRAMTLLGVTGTNGKTTTVYLLEAILRAAGRAPGIMTTIVTRWGASETASAETTPSGAKIARSLAEMRSAGVGAVAMEVSSHAIDQHRVDGVHFAAVGLTNVTQDHLDYHGTMEAYAATKAAIFASMRRENPSAVGVINLDDEAGRRIARQLPEANLLTYSAEDPKASLYLRKLEFVDAGLELDVVYRRADGETIELTLTSPMHCRFNAMNILTAAGLALAAGVEPEAIRLGIADCRGAPGRFEMIDAAPGVRVIVDYAHTPDAVSQLLTNARAFARERLIAVVGCGGDRDAAKRPIMGRVAAELSDHVIVTNDNPRTEDPEAIARQIVAGITEAAGGAGDYRVVLDRRQAIAEAIGRARKGDVVVIAGKGHEDYQILGKRRIHFDDREVAREVIAALAHSDQS